MQREEVLLQNLYDVRSSLAAACQRVGRDPEEVTLVAVTKYAQDADVLSLLNKAVLSDIAESRVQQAWARWKENPDFAKFSSVRKHFIGHLQTNKAAKAAALFDYIDSLDDLDTAAALSKHVAPGKILRALVQVKLTQRPTQAGLPLEKARRLAQQVDRDFKNIAVCGYMAIAPQGATEAQLRQLFRPLRRAWETDFANTPHKQLSLGMSEDFITAVEEGSTLPRIGSLLFSRNLEGI